jgi:hypothetical protein
MKHERNTILPEILTTIAVSYSTNETGKKRKILYELASAFFPIYAACLTEVCQTLAATETYQFKQTTSVRQLKV